MRKTFLVLLVAIALFGCGKPQPQGTAANTLSNNLLSASIEKTYISDNNSIVIIKTNIVEKKIDLDYSDISINSNKIKSVNSDIKKYDKPILSPEKILNAN